jgi:hypothetical protein
MGEVVNLPNPEAKQENKLTYAELENIANNLYARLQSVEMSNMFKRLDYLFKVVNYREAFTPEFVKHCIEEIEMVMTLPTEENNDN